MHRAMVRATEDDQVVQRVRAAVLAFLQVMDMELVRVATAGHATAVVIAGEHQPTDRRRDLRRQSLRPLDIDMPDGVRIAAREREHLRPDIDDPPRSVLARALTRRTERK